MTSEECVRQFQGHFTPAICKLLPLMGRDIKHPVLVKRKIIKKKGRAEKLVFYPIKKRSLTDHKK